MGDPKESKCPGNSVCCHETNIKKAKQQPCQNYNGFKCVEKTSCLDEPLKSFAAAETDSAGYNGICPSSSQICCYNVLQKTVKTRYPVCEDNPGKVWLFS